MELKSLFIEPTVKTPQIDFNHLTGELILSGRSIPENAAELYENVLKWVLEYIKNPRHTTNLRFNLEYFNTASSIWLAKIIKGLCSIKDSEYTLMIHLYFNIEEFDNMEVEDLKDALSPIIDMIGTPTISIGIKIYGTDDKGEILKESMVLI
ncbi:MAG: SiaC family regulatory phosphoprotein [Bacteroidia bacterium]|nr:SiaC family regulatory phosphoprotein [Bacteroidia bacterium]